MKASTAASIDGMTPLSDEPPSKKLLLMELRALPELMGFAASLPTMLALAPRGDGQPVLVLPGLATSDNSTLSLRTFLSAKGYPTYGWDMGRNYGPLPGVEDGLKAAFVNSQTNMVARFSRWLEPWRYLCTPTG